MIDFGAIGRWLLTIPIDVELVESGVAVAKTPEFARFEAAFEAAAKAYGAIVKRDATSGHITTIAAPPAHPQEAGAHGGSIYTGPNAVR